MEGSTISIIFLFLQNPEKYAPGSHIVLFCCAHASPDEYSETCL